VNKALDMFEREKPKVGSRVAAMHHDWIAYLRAVPLLAH